MRGHVSVSVIIDEDGRPIDGAWAEPLGLPDMANGDLGERLEKAVGDAMARAKRGDISSDTKLEELITRAISSTSNELVGKKPIVTVMINRLEA